MILIQTKIQIEQWHFLGSTITEELSATTDYIGSTQKEEKCSVLFTKTSNVPAQSKDTI